MKKILFAFAALMMMVCTAVSLTSCGDDESTTKMVCWGAWRSYGTTNVGSAIDNLDLRTNELLGETFKLPYEEKNKTFYLYDSDVQAIVNTLKADDKIGEYVKQLRAAGAKEIDFCIGTSQSTIVETVVWTY